MMTQELKAPEESRLSSEEASTQSTAITSGSQKIERREHLRIDDGARANNSLLEPGTCAIEVHFVDLDRFGFITSPRANFFEPSGFDEVDHLGGHAGRDGGHRSRRPVPGG